jgi:hypothetical protein
MFTKADAGAVPPIRLGVWRTDKPNCAVDETKPQNQWPQCADAMPVVAAARGRLEVAGDPDLLQMRIPFPRQKAAGVRYLYVAFRPLKLDPEGRVVAMKSWPVRCGPPPAPDMDASTPPSPSEPVITSLTDPSSVTRVDTRSADQRAAEAAEQARLEANLAAHRNEVLEVSKAMAAVTPTTAPLTGLTMTSDGGCRPLSAAVLRNAARASEAWADDNSTSHWVRDSKLGDRPPASLPRLVGQYVATQKHRVPDQGGRPMPTRLVYVPVTHRPVVGLHGVRTTSIASPHTEARQVASHPTTRPSTAAGLPQPHGRQYAARSRPTGR